MSDETFYEQNAQCWRCRMYVPRVEMKYYAGLLYCPICYQDVAEAGGRCQLCGKQLEIGEVQICHDCREKKKEKEAKDKCHRCGSRIEGGICPKCSRGEPPSLNFEGEPGRPVGTEYGLAGARTGQSKSEYEKRSICPGIICCSRCRQTVESPTWQGGQPFCQTCIESKNVFLPLRIMQKLGLMKKNIREKDAGSRIKVKRKEEGKKPGSREK